MFENPIFKKLPALAALETVQHPNPEHIRACLCEMIRVFIALEKRMENQKVDTEK